MLWDKNYAVSYYATIVDPVTYVDKDRFELKDGSYITKVGSGLRCSAEINIDFKIDEELLIRIYMDTEQDQTAGHNALFTGYAVSPKHKLDGNLISQSVPCYGILEHAEDVLLPLGWYASAGRPATDIIKELLEDVPLEIEGVSPTLNGYIVAENNETKLSMTDKILTSIGWNMTVDGLGTVHLKQPSTEPVAIFSADYDMIEPSIDIEQDLYSVPNVFRVIYGDTSAIVRDTDSQYSIEKRGREIWAQEEISELPDDMSLAQYAYSRLKELQKVGRTITYARRFMPNVDVGDVVAFNYDEIEGNYRIKNQKITLTHNGRTEEVSEWIL